MTKPDSSTKAAADAKWKAEQKRVADEKQAKEDRQKFLSTGIATADANMNAPESVLRKRKRQDALLALKLEAKKAKGLDRVKAELAIQLAKAKYDLVDAVTDTTLVDKSKKGDLLPKIRTASKSQEKLRQTEPSLHETGSDGKKRYSDKAKAGGKVFSFTVFTIDIPGLWATDGGEPLTFSPGPGWSTWTKKMETSELGYEELEEDGWTQVKVQRHIEKVVTPELRGKFFPWLKAELKQQPVDEDLVKQNWATLSAKLTKAANAAAVSYIEDQIKKRKTANAALTDFKVDSAVEVSKAVATVAVTAGVAAGTLGAFSPFAIISIIRAGLTVFNEAVKQFASQAQTAAIIKRQLDGMWLQMGTTKEKLEEEYRRAKYEGKPVPKSDRAGLATFVAQSVSDFLNTELLPTVKNVRVMTEAHGHKITELKNSYSQLVDVQKAFARYEAKWAGGDVLAYVNGLPEKDLKKLHASKTDVLQLSKTLKEAVDEALRAQDLHVKKMNALFAVVKAANQLQKGFEQSASMLEAKNPNWTNVAVALVDTAVAAGLGAGDIVHAAEEAEKQFAIVATCKELAESVTELSKEVRESAEYKALAVEIQKRALEMKKAFTDLKATVTA
jgi:hypothetical protein